MGLVEVACSSSRHGCCWCLSRPPSCGSAFTYCYSVTHSPPYKLGIPPSLLYRQRSSPFLFPPSSSSFFQLLCRQSGQTLKPFLCSFSCYLIPPPQPQANQQKMRTGSCSVQQGLTPEAASVVTQAVNLARRRGHTQVTPLHVANTMLSSPTGLLRAACLRSHSHPLRCKALELCFNVALNRLPASAPYHARHHLPSLSNALVAAFKRAQANHRRGCVEAQQPALLAVKIELEQLVVSILDDPSVSRVMREAGFCSTQVKSNVEQSIFTESCVATPPQTSTTKPAAPTVKDDDIASVVEALVSMGRRSLVVVGECSDTIDAVVRGVIDRVDRGEVPVALRNSEFIALPLFSFRHMSREEVDQKVAELRCLLRRCCVGRVVVLYLGNLRWISQYRVSSGEKGRSPFCPVEHVVMEISSLVCEGVEVESSSRRLWLMGTATYQTYMRCKIGQPSLETLWGLQPLTIPSDSLGLSLKCER